MIPTLTRAAPAWSSWVKKALAALHITVDSDAVLVFRKGWNEVIQSGMLKGSKLAVNNIADNAATKAMQMAMNFQDAMPKGWVYYVKKARYINEQNKPKYMR